MISITQVYNRTMDQNVIQKLETFFSAYPEQEGQKGTILITAQMQPTSAFYIVEGIIRRYWITEKGEEITLNLYKPHTFLPMSWVISDVPNAHFYEAMTDVKLRKAPKEAVLAFLHAEPEVVFDLLRRVYIGMEGLWIHMESLTAGNSYTKLCVSLVTLGKRFGKKDGDEVVVDMKMTESELANYAGMSRETASRELHKLKQEHLVDFDKGQITIHDLQKLEETLHL